jgi:archaellin
MGVYLKQKRVTVTTAGTRVQIDSALKVASVTITADPTNNGTIYVGDIAVNAAARLGQPQGANESLELSPPTQFGTQEQLDLSLIYVDATANGDSVIVSWYERTGSS